MTAEFKVTIGIKEIRVTAESEGDAANKALADLTQNVAWVQASKTEPRQTGFKYTPDSKETQ